MRRSKGEDDKKGQGSLARFLHHRHLDAYVLNAVVVRHNHLGEQAPPSSYLGERGRFRSS